MSVCRQWKEIDDEYGNMYEFCNGKGKKCSCSGLLVQCDFPTFYNIPDHRIKEQREREQGGEIC